MLLFEFCWRDAAEFVEESAVVEPVDPFQGGEFEVVDEFEEPLEALMG